MEIIKRAGTATFAEAADHEDVHRIPKKEEKQLTAAFKETIERKMAAKADLIAQKIKTHDECAEDYKELSIGNYVLPLLKPMRAQLAECRIIINQAEDELHKIKQEKQMLTDRESRQRALLAYYTQLLRELECIRGDELGQGDDELSSGERAVSPRGRGSGSIGAPATPARLPGRREHSSPADGRATGWPSTPREPSPPPRAHRHPAASLHTTPWPSTTGQ